MIAAMQDQGTLDAELRRLLADTNDQRRRFGKALYHFYRTLIFWGDRGASFAESTRMWAAGGAAIFDGMAGSLRELTPHNEDQTLRTFSSTFLRRLAEDLKRGAHMRVSFLRWLEARFPELTSMMQTETAVVRISDYDLAFELANLFARIARATDDDIPDMALEAAFTIEPRH